MVALPRLHIQLQADAGGGGAPGGAPPPPPPGGAAGKTGGTDGGQGGGTPPPPPSPWPSDLSADHKTIVTTKGWKGPADVLTAYAQLESTLGRDKIPLPGENAKPEEWDAVFNKLGRPATAEQYAFRAPDGVPIDEALDKRFREAAWKAGANEKTAGAIYNLWNEVMSEGLAAATAQAKQQVERSLSALKGEWGSAFDARLELANRVAAHAFGKDLDLARKIQLMDGSLLLDHPVIAKAFAVVGQAWAEPGNLPDNVRRSGFAPTPKEAATELERLRASGSAYWNKDHPEHRATVARVTELTQIAHPEERVA